MSFREASEEAWDVIYSLDDDSEAIKHASLLRVSSREFHGLYEEYGEVRYTQSTNCWNDMGVHSRFGLKAANKLKLSNRQSFYEIFQKFLESVRLSGILEPKELSHNLNTFSDNKLKVAIAPWGGNRWSGKSMQPSEVNVGLEKYSLMKNLNLVMLGVPPDNYAVEKISREALDFWRPEPLSRKFAPKLDHQIWLFVQIA